MDFHTIVIGSGSGGLTVATGLAKLNKSVALIERGAIGGDCTNVGCIPSKTLIHASLGPSESGEVLSLVRAKRDRLRLEETEWLQGMKNLTLFFGQARFLDLHTIRISAPSGEEKRVSAGNIVLSTGSRPRRISIPGLGSNRVLTNESLFELEKAPEHLVIVGVGAIGLEMAFAFRRLGTQVSLLDRGDRVLKSAEPEVSALLRKRLAAEKIALFSGAQASRYEEVDGTLYLRDGRILKGVDKVLLAVGRVPNLDLDLEVVGVESDDTGIPTDRCWRTVVKNIYAIGDINQRSAFTHSANHQGRHLVKMLGFPFLPAGGPEPHYPTVTFTSPEVAQVGPTLEELRTSYSPQIIKTQLILLKDTDRGYTQQLEVGFVLIHAMAVSGRVLAATIVAPAAGEMISLLTFAVNSKVTMYQLADLVFPYPVLSEAIKKASSNFVFETLGELPQELFRYVRYRFL